MPVFDTPRKRAILALVILLLLSACATHDGYERNFDGSIELCGFFAGLWRGFPLPLSIGFDILMFALSVAIYIVAAIYHRATHGLPKGDFVNLGDSARFIFALRFEETVDFVQ